MLEIELLRYILEKVLGFMFTDCVFFLRSLVFFFGLGVFATTLQAAPNIPPGLVEQAKRLTPAQQNALAAQYGIALPTTEASNTSDLNETLEAPLVLNRSIDEMTDSDDQSFFGNVIGSQEGQLLTRFGAQLFSDDLEAYAP